MSTIKYLRDQSAKEKIITPFESIKTNFSSTPIAIDHLIQEQ